MLTLLKLGLSGYDVFGRSSANISYKIYFFFRENVGGTRHLCHKNEPTIDRLGGGVHGKAACWLIAYKTIMQKLYTVIIYITQYSFTIYNI